MCQGTRTVAHVAVGICSSTPICPGSRKLLDCLRVVGVDSSELSVSDDWVLVLEKNVHLLDAGR